jgi:hypothetical protein
MEIPDIGVKDLDIKPINIPDMPSWLTSSPPQAIPIYPPVTEQVGVPIIDMPGCVEAHVQDEGDNKNLVTDDPKGVKIFCDAGMPSFNPMDYNRSKLKFEYEAPVPPIKPTNTPEVKAPVVPDTSKAVTAKVDCPTESQALKEPVGHIKGDEKVIEYRLVGKECIQVTEKLNIPEQVVGNLPSAGAVTATASIAVVATTSALLAKPLADLLLKAVKPTVKKVMKKIAALRGKKTQVESVKDRRDQQRIRSHAIRKLKGKE